MEQEKPLSEEEEIANVITHGVGTLAFAIASPYLILLAVKCLSITGVIAASIFVFGLISVYLSSTLYHWSWKSDLKLQYKLQVWDHVSIYLLIGGTYTIIMFKFMPDVYYSSFMTFLWATIFVGCLLKIFFTGKFRVLSAVLYLVLGWMAVFFASSLKQKMPANIFDLVLYGGFVYTTGTVFYIWRDLKYSHPIWHIFVLGGSTLHFLAIYYSIPLHIVNN